MLEIGGDLDLGEEAVAADDGGQLGVQDLDGDLAAVLQVLGEVDGGHAALAELAVEAIAVGEGIGEAVRRRWRSSRSRREPGPHVAEPVLHRDELGAGAVPAGDAHHEEAVVVEAHVIVRDEPLEVLGAKAAEELARRAGGEGGAGRGDRTTIRSLTLTKKSSRPLCAQRGADPPPVDTCHRARDTSGNGRT